MGFSSGSESGFISLLLERLPDVMRVSGVLFLTVSVGVLYLLPARGFEGSGLMLKTFFASTVITC